MSPTKKTLLSPAAATIPRRAAKATRSIAVVETSRGRVSRERICTVATQMFAEYGFAATSIRNIAAACAISIPSIYHFFGDKDRLYAACRETGFREAADRLSRALQSHEPGRQRILAFVVELCDVLLNDRNFARLLQRGLLLEECGGVAELTTQYLAEELALLSAEIERLTGKSGAVGRTFSICALVLGLTLLRRIGEVDGSDPALAADPERLARHALNTVLPKQRW